MYKYLITFYFINDSKTFEYIDLIDIIFDLNYNLYDLNKRSIYWLIERINYE